MPIEFEPYVLDKMSEARTEKIVRRAFRETGGDFDKPTKETITKAIDWLADFSRKFRKPEAIKKHYDEIMQLVSKLDSD